MSTVCPRCKSGAVGSKPALTRSFRRSLSAAASFSSSSFVWMISTDPRAIRASCRSTSPMGLPPALIGLFRLRSWDPRRHDEGTEALHPLLPDSPHLAQVFHASKATMGLPVLHHPLSQFFSDPRQFHQLFQTRLV